MTTKSISSVIIQFVLSGFSTVNVTVCVAVIKGLGNCESVIVFPFSSTNVNSISSFVISCVIPVSGFVRIVLITSEVSKVSYPSLSIPPSSPSQCGAIIIG